MKGHSDSLLDFMCEWARCSYLSDLHYLNGFQKGLILHRLENVRAQDAELEEWIDALDYLTGIVPALTAQEVRQQIMTALAE